MSEVLEVVLIRTHPEKAVPAHVLAAWAAIHADLQRHLEDAWRERLAFEFTLKVGGEGGMPRRWEPDRKERRQIERKPA